MEAAGRGVFFFEHSPDLWEKVGQTRQVVVFFTPFSLALSAYVWIDSSKREGEGFLSFFSFFFPLILCGGGRKRREEASKISPLGWLHPGG